VWVHNNKQGFQDCEAYACLEQWLGKKADEYWDNNFDSLSLVILLSFLKDRQILVIPLGLKSICCFKLKLLSQCGLPFQFIILGCFKYLNLITVT